MARQHEEPARPILTVDTRTRSGDGRAGQDDDQAGDRLDGDPFVEQGRAVGEGEPGR